MRIFQVSEILLPIHFYIMHTLTKEFFLALPVPQKREYDFNCYPYMFSLGALSRGPCRVGDVLAPGQGAREGATVLQTLTVTKDCPQV